MDHVNAIALDKDRMIVSGPPRPDVRIGDKLVLNATTFRMLQAKFSERHGAHETVLTISDIPTNENRASMSWRSSTLDHARQCWHP